MPEYNLICQSETCRHTFSAHHSIHESHPICPLCGAETCSDLVAQGVPAMHGGDFHGNRTKCIDAAFHPKEAAEAAKVFGGRAGNCINPKTGDVSFRNKSDAREFYRREAEIRSNGAEKRAMNEAKGPPQE